MGIRKRWSRQIVVGGSRYRYHVADDRHDASTLQIAIQQVDPAGQRLLSTAKKPCTVVETGPSSAWHRPIPHAVTPSVIRKLIDAALDRGWHPSVVGLADFHFALKEVISELPKPDVDRKTGA